MKILIILCLFCSVAQAIDPNTIVSLADFSNCWLYNLRDPNQAEHPCNEFDFNCDGIVNFRDYDEVDWLDLGTVIQTSDPNSIKEITMLYCENCGLELEDFETTLCTACYDAAYLDDEEEDYEGIP